MSDLPREPVPAPGFKLISGKRAPKEGKYQVQFRNGYIDDKHEYSPSQLRWVHEGHAWDVVAVRTTPTISRRA